MLLPFVAVALLAGGVVWIVKGSGAAEIVWLVATGVVAFDLVAVTAARLREGRIAVDLVALGGAGRRDASR